MTIDTVEREKFAIKELTGRLSEMYGEHHDQKEIASEVAVAHRRFENRPIRDFIPIFVERIVRARLET